MENVIVGSSSSARNPGLGRSIGAVVAGFVTILVTHTGTDAVLHATGVYPAAGQVMSDALFALALGYRFCFSVLGAYVTARLAPSRPLKHALVLGGIGVVLSLAGLIATYGRGPEFGPFWYPLSLVLVSLPCCWLGAKLAARPT
ncbi:MAG TPA: hypothetical protein VEQ59_13055 [Polyangiaceae bacterium]|nr:hypothetical protein [Polyangiaceae bacterium]